jgi:hypothetical protein
MVDMNDSRLYFAIFDKDNVIYMASIASQAEHHKDDSDTDAVLRADLEIKKAAGEYKEMPL